MLERMNLSKLHPDWLVPRWPAPAHVRAVFTTRAGGVSMAPFDSLNLGRPSGDDPAAVDTNRRRLEDAIGHAPVFLHQVHGVVCVALPSSSPEEQGAVIEADASASRTPGVVCTVRVADCLPVLLTDRAGRAVAAAHAGWRGLAQGVLEQTVGQLRGLIGSHGGHHGNGPDAADLVAWLGPCIGPQAFEVGGEVRTAFMDRDARAASCFVPHAGSKWMADLAGLARQRLQTLGIAAIHGNDSSPPWCTVGNPSRFFSHRRDAVVLGGSGRMAACIWIG
jgi:YfiH family protein